MKFQESSDIVTNALQKGVSKALLRYKQLGNPICVWRNDKVIWIAPKNIKIKKER